MFHTSKEPLVSYDLFNVIGQYPDKLLKIYQDNKIIESGKHAYRYIFIYKPNCINKSTFGSVDLLKIRAEPTIKNHIRSTSIKSINRMNHVVVR